MYTGVLRHSLLWPFEHLSFRLCIKTLRTSQCNMVIENEGTSFQSIRTSIREVVKECSPGGGAMPSNPQAARVSIAELDGAGAELAAAQQSKTTKTSDFALSNKP